MRLLIFGSTLQEQNIVKEYLDESGLEVEFTEGILDIYSISKVKGFEAVWIMTNSQIGEKEAKVLKEHGVKYIVTRSTGYDHLDLAALKTHGIKAANVPSYSPNAISEYTILLLLMALRKMKRTQSMVKNLDYGVNGICGREIRMLTIGVVGTGTIGSLTVQALHGFGAKVVAHSRTEREELSQLVEYVSLEELYRKADVIILHCPLQESNYHMINRESIQKCKDGVVIINTSRGGLVDCDAILEGIDAGKISSFALDVYENEDELIRNSYTLETHPDKKFVKLCEREEVVYTPHTSFYTDQAVKEIIKISIDNAKEYVKNDFCMNELT